jgi:hypothetical protein
LGQVQKSDEVKPVDGIPHLLFDHLISNGNTYINKQTKKPAHIRFQSKRPNTITKMNNIDMDSTKSWFMNVK